MTKALRETIQQAARLIAGLHSPECGCVSCHKIWQEAFFVLLTDLAEARTDKELNQQGIDKLQASLNPFLARGEFIFKTPDTVQAIAARLKTKWPYSREHLFEVANDAVNEIYDRWFNWRYRETK